jgi:hypothetical protein
LESDATDVVGGFDGIVHGSPAWTSGKLGRCYDNTAGASAGVELMRHAEAKKFENAFSWSLWFKSTTTSGGSRKRILARDDSEYLTVTIDQSATGEQPLRSEGTGSAQVNKWHHLAVLHYPDTSADIYVDGAKQGTTSAPKSGAARPWVIGGNTEGDGDISGDHFTGKIDDVRLYDHVLSVHEIKELARGKVGHWTFGRGEATDTSAAGNNGTLSGSPAATSGIIGPGAMEFNGTDQHVSLPDVFESPSPKTIAGWVYTNDNTKSQRAVAFRGSAGILPFWIAENSNGYVSVWQGSTHSDLTTISSNTWTHFAVTDDGTDLKLYKNGSLEAAVSPSPNVDGKADSLGADEAGIGSGWADFLDGRLDDVRAYASALTQPEIQDIYQAKGRIDENHRLFAHALREGAIESFRGGSFSGEWSAPNAFVKSDRSYTGRFSMGSEGQGSIDAEWAPRRLDGGEQIESFEYKWWERPNQTGHVVRLLDAGGNEVHESGTENPQWFLGQGDGGRTSVYGGDNYQAWTLFRFEFDWDAGAYEYYLKDLQSGTVKTGRYGLTSATNVEKIVFTGAGYGSANHNRFDDIKIGQEGPSKTGVMGASGFSEVGPAAGSMVGWWNFDRHDARDKAGPSGGSLAGGPGFVAGPSGGKALQLGGTGQHAHIPGRAALNLDTTGAYSVAAWVRASDNGDPIVLRHEGTNESRFVLNEGPGYLYKGDDGNWHGVGNAGSALDSSWHHVVWVLRGNTFWGYVDGAEMTSGASLPAPNTDCKGDLAIGEGAGSSEWLDGAVGEVRVYDRALSAEEVEVLYDMSSGSTMKMTPEGIYAPEISEVSL